MRKQQNSTPKLRFKSFSDKAEDAYTTRSFEDVFVFSTGMNIKQGEASPDFATPCVRYGELYHMYNEVITTVVNRTNIDSSELKFSDGDEILLPSAGEDPLDIGSASALTVKGVAIGRTINILKPKKAQVYDQRFASYYINQKLRRKISTLARGASISNVYNSDLKQLEIVLPTLPEQRKIADFLTAVDRRIQQLSQKKALLQDYKKGVMQQIFTQTLRFKDDHGNEFPDWEKKMLGDMCTTFSGGTPSSGKREYYGGTIPFIRSAEIAAENTALFLTENGFNASSAKMVEEGDLLVALYGANSGEVGISKISGAINQAILCMRTKECVRFLYFWLQFSKQSIVNTYLQGGQGNLSGKIVQSLDIEMPSLPEQTKIANFLTALDRKIESVGQQIELTQTFKRGLLQQMFV